MGSLVGIVTKYVVFPGVFAYALMQIAKPGPEELEKIKNFSPKNDQFSAVLKAAANPNAKPIYRQKPGQQHPVPELADEVNSK